MISETLIIRIAESLISSKGLAIYQICDRLHIEHSNGTSNYIASCLRRAGFAKDHQLSTVEPKKRAYLWFRQDVQDPRDLRIKELESRVSVLEAELKALEASRVQQYIEQLHQESISLEEVLEPSINQERPISTDEDISDEELETLRLLLYEDQ